MRCVLLASGSGTLTQAVLDAFVHTDAGVDIAAVGSDRPQAGVLERARAAGVETFSVAPADHADRDAWNSALTAAVAAHEPDWVVSAGFMRILGEGFVGRFAGRIINTHPALLPSFPGAHGVRDALAHGVKVTGTTIHLVDAGTDTGPIIAQFPVSIREGEDEDALHERIRAIERTRLVELLRHLAGGSLDVDGRRVTGWTPAP
ncbi:phosphoribosylglycinamide formyltransferase [Brevibacterium album]|uniref:phosphoribosylglycinamide formyltransferase n=1 Tax=Brevibacterium album TaxID=417948 RepID=UPI00041E3DB0|nr:phosphoribosylglycinamide formyltransferase [Brevibacterium album]